jgi:pimeloyl-ACP methyl ester carboxylesterase
VYALTVTSGFAEVNGARLYYEVAGAGPALVLLHGYLLDSGQWDDQLTAMGRHCQVVRYDARGFGRSTQPPEPFAPEEDLLGLLTFLGIDQAVLTGCSGGGAAVVDFALAHPQRTRALVLVGSALSGFQSQGPPPPPMVEYQDARERGDVDRAVELALRFSTDGERHPEQVDQRAREHMRAMMTRQFSRPEVAAERRRLEPPAAGRLAEIQVPTLVVVGDQDVPAVQAIADLVSAQVRDSRKVVIAQAGHHPNMEHPEQFNELLASFLAGLS